MNILITGINGFVGNNFVSIIKRNHAIYGLDIFPIEKEYFDINIGLTQKIFQH